MSTDRAFGDPNLTPDGEGSTEGVIANSKVGNTQLTFLK